MIPALLWKEWREQRWRLLLSVFVLATISASLVRAQLIPTPESILLSFGVLGLILTIFLSMGSVATERQDHTWPFLLAQPISRPTILRVKWLIGAINLLSALLLSGFAVTWAAWSRNVFDFLPPPTPINPFAQHYLENPNSPWWMWRFIGLAAVALLSCYTLLFFTLTRATDELHAGLGGFTLTLALLAWLAQYPLARAMAFALARGDAVGQLQTLFWWTSSFNPLSPIAFIFEGAAAQRMAVGFSLILWTLFPLLLVGRLDGKRKRSR